MIGSQGRKSIQNSSHEMDETIIEDIEITIQEWRRICSNLILTGNLDEYHRLRNQISCLLDWRRQILAGNLMNSQKFARSLIESRKHLDKSFSIPKSNGIETSSDLPLPQLLVLHREMQDRLIQGSFIPSNISEQYHFEEKNGLREVEVHNFTSNQVHLFLDMAASKIRTPFPFKLYFSVWKKSGFITDEFYVSLTKNGFPDENDLISRLSTIFIDLQRDNELVEELYLVCKAYVIAPLGLDLHADFGPEQLKKMNSAPQDKGKDAMVRRPFGCGIISFADLGFTNQSGKFVVTEIYLPLYCYRNSREKEFEKLHELIRERPNDTELVRTPHELALILCLLVGDIHTLQDPSDSTKQLLSPSYSLQKGGVQKYNLKERVVDSTLTPRYLQLDIVDIRDIRDEIYITLGHGNFSQDDKSAPKNIEITARLLNEKGEIIPNCITKGRGKQLQNKNSYISSVFYHENNPTYEETFRIDLNYVPNILNSHLYFEISHCSSGQTTAVDIFRSTLGRKKKDGQLFAFTYLLFKDKNTNVILGNGDHFLSTYTSSNTGSGTSGTTSTTPTSQGDNSPITPPSYLTSSTSLMKRDIKGTNMDEYLAIRVYVSSKKFTVKQEIHELFEWENITEPELNFTILNCINSDISDHLITSILQTSLRIISMKSNTTSTSTSSSSMSTGTSSTSIRLSAYQLFVKVLIQFYYKSYPSNIVENLCENLDIIKSLFNSLNEWIKIDFDSNEELSLVLLTCLWENIQTINKIILPSTPNISQFRKNLYYTCNLILSIVFHYLPKNQEQSPTTTTSGTSTSSITMKVHEILSSLLQYFSSFQPSDPTLYTLHRKSFFHFFHLSSRFFIDFPSTCPSTSASPYEFLSRVIVNFLNNLHSSSNQRGAGTSTSIKQDKYHFILQLMDTQLYLSSAIYRQEINQTLILILKDLLLSETYDSEPYVILLKLVDTFALGETTSSSTSSSSMTSQLSHLLPAFTTALARLLGGISVELQNKNEIYSLINTIHLENAVCSFCTVLKFIGKEQLFLLFDQIVENNTTSSSSMEGGVGVGVGGGYELFDGRQLLLLITQLFTSMLRREIFPSAWLVLKMGYLTHISNYLSWVSEYLELKKNILLTSSELSQYWTTMFIFPSMEININVDPLPNSDNQYSVNNLILWSSIFNLSLYLLLDPEISTELKSINPSKKQYLDTYHASFRDSLISSLCRCWNSIISISLKLKFINTFTIPILALTCSPAEHTLSRVGKTLLTDILICDYSTTQQFKLTSPHIYDCVCISVLNTPHTSIHIDSRYIPGVDAITKFLQVGLSHLFSESTTLNIEQSHNFAHEMKNLLVLLLNLSYYPQTLEYEEDRSYAYHKLMTFFYTIGRYESYIKTTHHLAHEMMKLENYLEAGNLICLHINHLDWSEKILEPLDLGGDSLTTGGVGTGSGGIGVGHGVSTGVGNNLSHGHGLGLLISEMSYKRKIRLITYAIKIYEQGQAYEECLSLLKNLYEFYHSIRPDYQCLIEILAQQMDYYNKIMTIHRSYPSTMFRVGYYGLGITNELMRNKEFIYKGASLESIIDFSNRIKKKYSQYEILSPKQNPLDYTSIPDKGYIQISKVTPTSPSGTTSTASNLHTLPSYIKNYQINQNLQYFYYQKPFRKREIKSSNEFLDLWVERRVLKSETSFPSISRRSLVISSEVIIYNPIEMAVEGLRERNNELKLRNLELKDIEDGQAGQSYTMTLSGTIDAAVNGGLSNYQCFIDGTYRVQNPEIYEDVNSSSEKQEIIYQLKACLAEQLQLLEEGMKLHQRKCLTDMRPLHNHLYLRFQEMKMKLTQLLQVVD